jgi:CheY-like chemotaxis protein
MTTSSDILNASILIVDDKRVNVELIHAMLSAAGYTSVASTVDPLEGCDLHRANRYDLILLDLMMPKMDGFQVMQGLRLVESEIDRESGSRLESGGCLPVLVITAQPEHKERALRAGAKGFITKPFDRLKVLTHIHDVLEIKLLQKALQRFISGLDATLNERIPAQNETEELVDQLAGNLPQIFWIWDIHDKTFRYINPAWERMTGRRISRSDTPEKFLEAVHPEDMQRVIQEAAELPH